MAKNISAEEKLLRLIRGKSHKTGSNEMESSSSRQINKSAIASLAKIKLKGLKFNQGVVNRILIGLSVLFLLFLISQIVMASRPTISKPRTFKDTLALDTDKSLISDISYKDFIKDLKKRQLFSASFGSANDKQKVDMREIKDLIKDITLVGIISKGNRLVAVIEDKQVNKTYFLSEGENMGELLISHIESGKVTLEYDGQAIDLYL